MSCYSNPNGPCAVSQTIADAGDYPMAGNPAVNPAQMGGTDQNILPQQMTGIPVGPNYSPLFQPSPGTANLFQQNVPVTPIIPGTPGVSGVPGGNLAPITPTTQPMPVTVESLQYINGYLRTQIGKRVTVEFLIGTNTLVDRTGTLLAVGANYILINEIETDDILVCDFYTIKFVRVYY